MKELSVDSKQAVNELRKIHVAIHPLRYATLISRVRRKVVKQQRIRRVTTFDPSIKSKHKESIHIIPKQVVVETLYTFEHGGKTMRLLDNGERFVWL